MHIRLARPSDAEDILSIYAPIVRETAISFELEPPTVEEMRTRISTTLQQLPWLVGEDEQSRVCGYVYASRHRERPAYQWSVDVTAYLRADMRGRGWGKQLYRALLAQLVDLGYIQAFAGIALPNDASVGLHESVGFRPIGIYRKVGYKHGAWRDVGWWQLELQRADVPPPPVRPLGGQA